MRGTDRPAVKPFLAAASKAEALEAGTGARTRRGRRNVDVGGTFEATHLAQACRADVRSEVLVDVLDQWRRLRSTGGPSPLGDRPARELLPSARAMVAV